MQDKDLFIVSKAVAIFIRRVFVVVPVVGMLSWFAPTDASIQNASSYAGRLEVGSLNRFEFSAVVGEAVHVRVIPAKQSKLKLAVWLYSPKGELVKYKDGNVGGVVSYDCHASSRECKFNQNGNYYLVIGDQYNANSGDYSINLMRLNASITVNSGAQNTQSSAGTNSTLNSNASILQGYQKSLINNVFHTPQQESNDGLQYLGGQCVAWAERLYDQIALKPITQYSYGRAANMPNVLANNGYTIVKDARKPKVGSLVIWDDGKAGHVGVVTAIKQGPLQADKGPDIVVSEANFGTVTSAAAMKWGLSLQEAQQEFVTDEYGRFSEKIFSTDSLDRGEYKFSSYIYP